MGARISVQQLLSTLGSSYQSIDVRVAAIVQESRLLNALTVVRLSYEDPATVANHHRTLQEQNGPVNTEHFRIALKALPFSRWADFIEDAALGILRLDDFTIELEEKPAIASQMADIRRYPSELRQIDQWQWPSFDTWFGRHRPERLGHDDLTREVGEHGWSSTYQAMNSLFAINIWQGGPYIYDFYLNIPIFALISEAAIDSSENALSLSVAQHAMLGKLKLIVELKELNPNRSEVLLQRIPVPLSESSSEEPIRVYRSKVNLPQVEAENLISAKIFHAKLGDLDTLQRSVRDLIPEAHRNSLLVALRHFCPDQQLRQLVTAPYEHKPKRLKPSAAFELHVAWILGLLGFSTIVLGEYERILARTGEVERASADILAARGHMLAVVACTISTPKDEDFSNLLHACEILRREVFHGTTIYSQPILFTGALGYAPYREIEGFFGAIPIIDTDRLGFILDLLQSGAEEHVMAFLANPMISPLQKLEDIE